MIRPPLVLWLLVAFAASLPAMRAWNRRRRVRRADWPAGALGAGLVLAAIPLGLFLGRPELPATLLVRDDAPVGTVDAVFVASGDVDYHRTIYAAEVFRESHAEWFILSGGGSGGDSAVKMAEAAIAAGVPEDSLLLEELAETSRENVVFGRPLLIDGVRTVAVVTDRLHSRRFSQAAHRAWPGVRVLAATVPESRDPLACQTREWRRDRACRAAVTSEWKKMLGYFFLGWL